MKPLAIAIGKRILLLAGDPKQLEDVEIEKNPNGNLVLVKKNLDTEVCFEVSVLQACFDVH